MMGRHGMGSNAGYSEERLGSREFDGLYIDIYAFNCNIQ